MPVPTPGTSREPSASATTPTFIAVGTVTAVSVVMWCAVTAAGGQDVPANPFAVPIYLMTGQLRWSTTATLAAIAITVAVSAVGGIGWWAWRRHRPTRSRIDTAQQHLGVGKDIESITEAAVRGKADELGVRSYEQLAPFTCTIGVPIGVTVVGGRPVYGSWEDMQLDLHGPRMGKSTGRIIPAICEAPGAVLVTENKRGNLDHTRLVREFRDAEGHPTRQVWVFDPQAVADESPWWWWNPLSYVTDEDQAEEFAQLFAAGEDGDDARKDPYFDPEGQDLLANLILASALAGEAITVVYERLAMRQRGHEAVDILDEHGYPLIARALNARLNYQAKQADGIWGTAIKMARCLRSRRIQEWITSTGPDDDRPQLDPATLVRHRETLYCLSKEGVGSAGPLVAALTVAVTRTAERIATASPGGRLPVPMVCALDEAANCVRWRDLPKMYSHYGSRGIIIMTILQSWSQGIGVWGERGMKLLESSSNIYVFGGNIREAQYLGNLKTLIGKYERMARNVSRSPGAGRGSGESVSRHTVKDDIFTEADLAAWPRGRMLLLSAGNRPTIVRAVPWWDKPYAHLIRASLAEYAPTATPGIETKTDTEREDAWR